MSDAAAASQRVRAALQRATERIKELEGRHREPIAVIGMACRLPGGDDPEQFWSTLMAGEDRIREIPDARSIGPWPEGVPRWAGLVDDVEGFDAGFFGISPREATSLDPQQRLLLELSWEALESAGVVPAKLRGSKTGVFVGLCSTDYHRRTFLRPPEERDAFDTTGNMVSTATGRISYVLGLQGPSVSIDTACSSSLVAVHLASRSLHSRDCDLALVGGINLILSEESSRTLSLIQALSPDGRCKTFDSAANGFVRGEGCGLLVLERLSDAQRNGRRVLAVIRGSAVNQDGRSTGLTAPNVIAQEALLREALGNAGVAPNEVGYVECHGTGTALGDPIEIEALKAVFGAPRSDGSKLWLGAVKTNIGHLEGAAGVAGIIKVLQVFAHERIPANLHLRHMNPRIKLAGTALTPVTEDVEWSGIAGRRIAGVSSFGISGTNAHVILEQAPPASAAERPASHACLPILLSGRTEAALRGQASRLAARLRSGAELDPVDLAWSLAMTRTHFEHRACLLTDELAPGLDDLAERGSAARVSSGVAKSGLETAVLFTGQGAQRLGMGKSLCAAFPVFRYAFEAVCRQFDAQLPRPLRDVVHASDAELLDQTIYTQPALFAFEVALYRLFESFGVVGKLLLGHSIGELTAAYIADVWSLEHAASLVAARGRLMHELPSVGKMLSVQASEAELADWLERHRGVDIAGLNGPLSTVLSGDQDPLRAIEREFGERGRKTKWLVVSHAFHSHHMDPMLESFRRVAESITYNPPSIPIISNVTGERASVEQLTSPDYWVRHIRQPVRFLDGVRSLQRAGVGLCLELGPRPVLSAMAVACLSDEGQKPELLSAGSKDEREVEAVVASLGTAHCHGLAIDWQRFFAEPGGRAVPLPSYAFQRERHWLGGDGARLVDMPVAVAPSRPADDGNAPVERGLERRAELLTELAGMSEPERARRLLAVVVQQVADVLGHREAANVSPDGDFTALGFDSLMAVELFKRLSAETGLELRATAAYDHPSPRKLSLALVDAFGKREREQPVVDDRDEQVRKALASLTAEQLQAAGLLEPLLALVAPPPTEVVDYDQLSDDELLDAADALLGDL